MKIATITPPYYQGHCENGRRALTKKNALTVEDD